MTAPWEFPQYEENGEERLAYQNLWRDIAPQVVLGLECFQPDAQISNDLNKLTLELTGIEFRRMFSALYLGAEIAYPQEFMQIIVNFLKSVHCPPTMDEEGDCVNYLPYAPFVAFSPQNPYSQPDEIPDGYEAPPFFVNSGLEYPASFGYKATDVFVSPAGINIDPIDLLTLNLPQIKIRVRGAGQIELDLLAVTLGSQAIIKIGSPPNLIDIIVDGITDDVTIIDLNTDSLSVPPETDIIVSEEINIEAAAGVETDVYIVFVPNLDDSLIPLRYGGGIRQIGLCGFEGVVTSLGVTDIRYNEEACLLEKFVDGEWLPVVTPTQIVNCANIVEYAYIDNKEIFIGYTSNAGGYEENIGGWGDDFAAANAAAAAAQTTANSAVTVANAAADDATAAQAAAAAAQTTANTALEDSGLALDNAAAAQTTANGAVATNVTQAAQITTIGGILSSLDTRVDALESLTSNHETRIDALEAAIGGMGGATWGGYPLGASTHSFVGSALGYSSATNSYDTSSSANDGWISRSSDAKIYVEIANASRFNSLCFMRVTLEMVDYTGGTFRFRLNGGDWCDIGVPDTGIWTGWAHVPNSSIDDLSLEFETDNLSNEYKFIRAAYLYVNINPFTGALVP